MFLISFVRYFGDLLSHETIPPACQDDFEDGTMKVYYKFNNSKYESRVFKKIPIDDIMTSNSLTVQIEMIVEEGEEMKDDNIIFD